MQMPIYFQRMGLEILGELPNANGEINKTKNSHLVTKKCKNLILWANFEEVKIDWMISPLMQSVSQ